jgi:hypothetical protein
MDELLKAWKIRGQNNTECVRKVSSGAFVGREGACRQQGRAQHHSKSLAIIHAAVRVQGAVEFGESAVKRIGDDADDCGGDPGFVRC